MVRGLWLVAMGAVGTVFLVGTGASGADWPQFRGPSADGRVAKIEHPLQWSADQNVAWKVVIPGAGWSSPVVVGDSLYVTSADTDKLEKPKNSSAGSTDPRSVPLLGGGKPPDALYRFQVHRVDRAGGEIVWSRLAEEAKPKIPVHPSNTFATETPASDGERIFAYFGTIGLLVAYDIKGEKLWEKRFEVFPMTNGFGPGSSLAVADGRLFLQRDNEKESTLAAFDAATGKELWSVPRPGKSSWSTPFIWRNKVRTELVGCGSGSVLSYDPATGAELWRLMGVSSSFSASPAATEELLFFGSSGPLSTSPLYAVKAGASGDITLAKGTKSNEGVAWSRTGSGPGLSSPVVFDGLLYVPGSGVLKCFDAKTGAEVYKQRLPKAKSFTASPWAAEGKLFLLDESGQTFFVKAGREFELVGVNTLSDTFWSTPAIADDSLFLRGVDGLYCVRNTSGGGVR